MLIDIAIQSLLHLLLYYHYGHYYYDGRHTLMPPIRLLMLNMPHAALDLLDIQYYQL